MTLESNDANGENAPNSGATADAVFEETLKDLAREESDHATDVFLEWFVNEQVEEEASTRAVIDQLKMVDGNPNGLFMIDRELAARQPESGEGE